MNWRYLVGACILAAGLLLPFAPWPDVVGGIALAVFINWNLQHRKGSGGP